MIKILFMAPAIFLAVAVTASAETLGVLVDVVFTPAGMIFKKMLYRDYIQVWSLLSERSKQIIVRDLSGALHNAKYSEASIAEDLRFGGPIAQAYWDSYLSRFNPMILLEQSKWDIGNVTNDMSESRITYDGSEAAAILTMHKENGAWKVGLAESFWFRP